jgi:hypothetical protein
MIDDMAHISSSPGYINSKVIYSSPDKSRVTLFWSNKYETHHLAKMICMFFIISSCSIFEKSSSRFPSSTKEKSEFSKLSKMLREMQGDKDKCTFALRVFDSGLEQYLQLKRQVKISLFEAGEFDNYKKEVIGRHLFSSSESHGNLIANNTFHSAWRHSARRYKRKNGISDKDMGDEQAHFQRIRGYIKSCDRKYFPIRTKAYNAKYSKTLPFDNLTLKYDFVMNQLRKVALNNLSVPLQAFRAASIKCENRNPFKSNKPAPLPIIRNKKNLNHYHNYLTSEKYLLNLNDEHTLRFMKSIKVICHKDTFLPFDGKNEVNYNSRTKTLNLHEDYIHRLYITKYFDSIERPEHSEIVSVIKESIEETR